MSRPYVERGSATRQGVYSMKLVLRNSAGMFPLLAATLLEGIEQVPAGAPPSGFDIDNEDGIGRPHWSCRSNQRLDGHGARSWTRYARSSGRVIMALRA